MTDPSASPVVRVVGDGRAGGSFSLALRSAGWDVEVVGREYDGAELVGSADLVLLCVPDGEVARVAAGLPVDDDTVVAHCAGSLGLDALGARPRRATVHPLVSLPSPEIGAQRLGGAWFGTSGDPLVLDVVEALGGRAVDVPDDRRVEYHAAAAIASNHLVALLGQVERVAAAAGVPVEAYLALASGSLDNVAELGPAAALTGPVARGDWDTVRRHLHAIDPSERPAYVALARAAARLVGRDVPPLEA